VDRDGKYQNKALDLNQTYRPGSHFSIATDAACHGSDLKGTAKGPPFLHRIYLSSHHSDMAFQIAAKSGVRSHHWQFGDMPPIPLVTPDSVAHIIAYIRREQQKAVIE
jgi:hypothetical protein